MSVCNEKFLVRINIYHSDDEILHLAWLLKGFWAHLCVCTVGSYASQSVCMSVCLSVTWPKFILEKKSLDKKSYKGYSIKCSLHSAYTASTPLHCRYTTVQAGPWQRQVGSLQRQVAFLQPFCSLDANIPHVAGITWAFIFDGTEPIYVAGRGSTAYDWSYKK